MSETTKKVNVFSRELPDIPQNVNEYMKKCGEVVANYEKDMFDVDLYNTIIDNNIKSPIEQLFLSAVYLITKIEGYSVKYIFNDDNKMETYGIMCEPQKTIGKYRADFVLTYYNDKRFEPLSVIVELDGHEFHEMNERQRRYEKARDRYFQKIGYKIFHYTGSEIVKNPVASAAECVAYLTNTDADYIIAGLENYGY